MRILAIDTATENCSAALSIDGRVLGRNAEFERGHAEHILSMVDDLLAEAGTTLRSLDALAFGRGPGSFTGVRLAASVTQGLAFGAGLGVVPISDLQAVAQRVFELDAATARTIVCNDARMHEVYWACFERTPGAQGRSEALAAPVAQERVGKPGSVTLPSAWTLGVPAATVRGAGRGFAAYPELRSIPGVLLGEGYDRLLPRALEIATLAVEQVKAGRIVGPEAAIPVYLRDDIVQAKP